MIKGFLVLVPPDERTLLWKSAKQNTLVTVRSCTSGARIGDKEVTSSNGFRLTSQEANTFRMDNNDELYVIGNSGCMVSVLIQE